MHALPLSFSNAGKERLNVKPTVTVGQADAQPLVGVLGVGWQSLLIQAARGSATSG